MLFLGRIYKKSLPNFEATYIKFPLFFHYLYTFSFFIFLWFFFIFSFIFCLFILLWQKMKQIFSKIKNDSVCVCAYLHACLCTLWKILFNSILQFIVTLVIPKSENVRLILVKKKKGKKRLTEWLALQNRAWLRGAISCVIFSITA